MNELHLHVSEMIKRNFTFNEIVNWMITELKIEEETANDWVSSFYKDETDE